ncbi:WD domain, g-beta repeat domain-containing protein [Ditylenchus destructor]|uniref:WD domain, g-beta repeat domain-containing protein n=1 Tax=Ditylenchus destructor TaxID=166010 RepID=A0AAD4NLL7_9BILA|nr:WD domain, g-beta repeat domain-containing protein [Ditylenchus destructor]
MNVNFQFSDVIGGVYKNGNVKFLPDGTSVLSPIGNKLKMFMLKENLSRTLAVESEANITRIALNRSGTHAFVVNETGACFYINVTNEILLHRTHIGRGNSIRCAEFSPDGSSIALCTGGEVKLYSLGSIAAGQFHPTVQFGHRRLSSDSINCLQWAFDGRVLCCGGEDRVIRVFSSKKQFANMSCATMSQRYPLVATYFFGNGYDVLAVDRSGAVVCWEASLKPQELISRTKDHINGLVEPALNYQKVKRNNLMEHAGSSGVFLTASALNAKSKLLSVAFSNGVFLLCELTEFSVLQNFRASELRINTLDINDTGDWLAIGCGQGFDAQLIVWEWQSESYVLKQQSHSQTITSVAYSPDASLLVTGAEDGKVKIWNFHNSFCIVTFTEHNSGVTDVCFTQSGKAILSASLEGSVRAHDLKRYRNFRTMVAPKQTQLNCLYKTLRLWNVVDSSSMEPVQLMNEGLDVKYSPCGHIVAVLCYDSCISLFQADTATEIGTIETRSDIDAGRETRDKVKKSTSERNKTFTCIAFSPDSLLILAGGQSNTFCLYSVPDRLLLKIFKLSANVSLDGVLLDVDYRKFTEFGNVDLFDCSDSEDENARVDKKLKLPGTRHTDLSERSVKPSIRVNKMEFSPTGRNFAVVSTEGVSIYTLDARRRFNPFNLETEITPSLVFSRLRNSEYGNALGLALRLNEKPIIRTVVESVPVHQIKFVIKSLEIIYAEKLLKWLAALDESVLSKHLHFYQILIHELLYCYGADLKNNLQQNLPAIISIQQTLNNQTRMLSKLTNKNKNSIEYILAVRELRDANTNGS